MAADPNGQQRGREREGRRKEEGRGKPGVGGIMTGEGLLDTG